MIQQFAEQTPGAEAGYVQTLNTAVKALEEQTQQKIIDGRKATQARVDAKLKALETANTEVGHSKERADAADSELFNCIAQEQGQRQDVEKAQSSLASSRKNQDEACQL